MKSTNNLPADLHFSQSSLQDFETCPRRLRLKYIDQLRWPAIEAEPVAEAERLARLGSDFHRLVQQHLIGLAADTLAETVRHAEPDLQRWWRNYLAHRPGELATAEIWPELTLSAPLRGFRLLAKFDALARLPAGEFLIIDWKTAQKKPSRPALERRLQTRVYLYTLAVAGAALNHGQPVNPAALKMLYWYPEFPTEPEEFTYSQQLLARDELCLADLIERIKIAAQRDDFPLADSQQACACCVYRSFCARAVAAGPLADLPEPGEVEPDVLALDWDQIAEIQF